MARRTIARIRMIGILLAVFALGYVCGVSTPRASAQLPQVPGMGSNPLAAASQMGSSLTEMEQHISGLQKNLDALKKVQSLLGGGK
ncbi:MAG TPA: hypothetical protein VFE48_01900 [Methylomirabilota bacterium]|nr:hypothetical protein [Methylomirabilota bacterium]